MTEVELLRKRLKEAEEKDQQGRASAIRLLLEQAEAAESFTEVEKNGKQYQRRVDGDYPAEAFAYVPDKEKPTTWKVLLWASPDGKMTAEKLGQAAAALSSGGFRGEKADIPAGDLPKVKAKIRAAYKKVGVKAEEMPDSVKETKDAKQEQVVAGSYEELRDVLCKAVQANVAAFGVAPSVDGREAIYATSIEATFPGYLIVSNYETQKFYKIAWSKAADGTITLGEPQEVAMTFEPKEETVEKALERAFPDATARRMTETFEAPVTIVTEAEGRKDGKRTMTVECLLGCAEVPTANGRVYPRALFEKLVKLEQDGAPEAKRWLGEMDHPADGRPRLAETVSTAWRSLRLEEDGKLYGTTDIIPTARGKDLMEQVRAGVNVQNSSRAFGKEKTETRDGRTVQVVQPDGLEWGGWDFVLGAAYSSAGITRVLESARGRDESQDDIEMTAEELKAALEAAAQSGGTTAAKLLLESIQKQEEEGKRTETQGPPAPPDTKAIIAEVVGALDERDKKNAEAAKALTDARTAKLEEIASWDDTPRKLMSEQLRQAATAEQIATIFEQQKQALTSVGLLTQETPAGDAKATQPGDGVHNEVNDRAKRFQMGLLEKKYLPRSAEEAIHLFSEGIPDNGKRFRPEMADPDDPLATELLENAPFRGYHPANPRHQFEAILWNTIREHRNSLRFHIANGIRPQLEYTGQADIVPGEPFMLPLIRQVWDNLAFLQDLMSVQPMNRSTGYAYYLDFQTDPGGGELGAGGTSEVASDYANNVSEQATIPAIKLSIARGAITMDTKKLKYDWSVEVGQDLQMDFGLDAGAELLNAGGQEIAREIFYWLLNTLLNDLDLRGRGPTMGNQNFGLALPAAGYDNLPEWRRDIFQYITNGDALVEDASGRNTNWIIAGTQAAARLRGMENYKLWEGEQMPAEIGIERVGTIAGSPRWAVYSTRNFPNSYQMLLGRKGNTWNDAAMVYCPYIPVYVSPVHVTEDLCKVQAMMSRFGKAKVDARLLTTITMQPGVAGTPL